MSWILVALGGALGSVLRFWLTRLSAWRCGTSMYGTLLVNVLGALLLGVVMVALSLNLDEFELAGSARHYFAFFEVGFLGGFTTFATFALELRTLLQSRFWVAMSYLISSVLLTVIGLILGYIIGGVWFYG